jgi:predicted Ser/Thr protein kinase
LPGEAGEVRERFPLAFGRYRIEAKLGQGGMAAVYLASDAVLGRSVALKIPFLYPGAVETIRERFRREARAAATLDHPNICQIFDVGEHAGRPYLAMAYIRGQPLTERLNTSRAMPVDDVLRLVQKLAGALQYAHDRGVIHRDLKPANIMINDRDEPVVMDFGLARREEPGDFSLTRSGQVVGTPAYMAPEQIAGQRGEVGRRSDVYSLGVVLYQLLTGRLPFEHHQDLLSLVARIATQPPAPPSGHRPELDRAIDRLVLKALCKAPEDRFGSMTDFATAISQCLSVVGGDARARETKPRWTFATGPRARLAFAGAVAAGLIVVVLAIPGWRVFQQQESRTKVLTAPQVTKGVVQGAAAPRPAESPPENVSQEDDATTGASPNRFVMRFYARRPDRPLDTPAAVPGDFERWRELFPPPTDRPDYGWTFQGGTLRSDAKAAFQAMPVGIIPYPNYELRARFRREQGLERLLWILPLGRNIVIFVLNDYAPGEQSRTAGFELINERSVREPENPSRATQPFLSAGVDHEILFQVQIQGETVHLGSTLNGASLSSWTGPLADVGMNADGTPDYTWEEPIGTIAVATWDAQFTFC